MRDNAPGHRVRRAVDGAEVAGWTCRYVAGTPRRGGSSKQETAWLEGPVRSLPADPIAREWVELHDNPPFAAWVAFLRAELDCLIPALTPSARDRCARFFAEATRLERAFFEAARTAG
jgi:thiaminase